MKTIIKRITAGLFLIMLMFAVSMPMIYADNDVQGNGAGAAQTTEIDASVDNGATGNKALAAAIAIGLAAAGGAIGMGVAIAKSSEGISRQPEAESKIRTSLMLGLVFVETAIIYALIVAILIIFVL